MYLDKITINILRAGLGAVLLGLGFFLFSAGVALLNNWSMWLG